MEIDLDQNILTHGIIKKNTSSRPLELHLEELRIKGYTLVESGLSTNELDLARDKLDNIYQIQVREVGGEENLKLMNDTNIARALCGYDELFLKIATLPVILELSSLYFEQYFVLMSQNGILNHPGTDHYQFTWHRDLNYQHFTSSKPIALSALVAIDPFDNLTGGTYILPSTHMVEDFPSDLYVLKNQEVVNAKPGTIIFFNAMLFHRTGKNISNNIRRAINHIIVPPMLRQQYNFMEILKANKIEVDDPMTCKYLGFDYSIPDSIQSWRKRKISLISDKDVTESV